MVKRISDADLNEQIRIAGARSRVLQKTEPRAKSVNVLHNGRALHIGMTNHGAIEIPVSLIPELSGISSNDLGNVRIDPLGKGLIWDDSDVALDFVAILERMFGSILSSAAAKSLGSRTSAAKAEASKINGQKGGRPRKHSVVAVRHYLKKKKAKASQKARTPSTGQRKAASK